MKIRIAILCIASSLAVTARAAIVTMEGTGFLNWKTEIPFFFDSSVEPLATPFETAATLDTSTLQLIDFVDASDPSSGALTRWTWGFGGLGAMGGQFGSYSLQSSVSRVTIEISHLDWNAPGEFNGFLGLQSAVIPESPDSAIDLGSSLVFTKDGLNFNDLWIDAPKIYFGTSFSTNFTFYPSDPSNITETWIRDDLWTTIAPLVSVGNFNMFGGSYHESGSAFGNTGGSAADWNNGSFRYAVESQSASVPDTGSTLRLSAMAMAAMVAALRLKRRADA